jgi:hypothetical protein
MMTAFHAGFANELVKHAGVREVVKKIADHTLSKRAGPGVSPRPPAPAPAPTSPPPIPVAGTRNHITNLVQSGRVNRGSEV